MSLRNNFNSFQADDHNPYLVHVLFLRSSLTGTPKCIAFHDSMLKHLLYSIKCLSRMMEVLMGCAWRIRPWHFDLSLAGLTQWWEEEFVLGGSRVQYATIAPSEVIGTVTLPTDQEVSKRQNLGFKEFLSNLLFLSQRIGLMVYEAPHPHAAWGAGSTGEY